MLKKIPDIILRNRILVLLGIVIMIVVGVWSAGQLPVDVYPNLNAPVVSVVTENHGMAPEEVETLITFPMETALNSLPYVNRVRSSSILGLSLIYIEFEYGTDIYFARQLVLEKLQTVAGKLPKGIEEPFLGPVSSMFADAVEFTITGAEDLYTLRDLAEWTIKPRLQTVPGVSNVINFGGFLKQYHVLIDPNRLINYRITVKQVIDVLRVNNRNSSGGYLIEEAEEKIIRGLGRIKTIEDIENIVVVEREGVPIMIKQIADVKIGPFLRRGTAGESGKEVVAVTIQNQYNANVMNTIKGVSAEVGQLQKVLGNRISLSVFYTQLDMIIRAITNVRTAIYISVILVFTVLLVLLGNIRITLITAISIPLSIVIAFIFMRIFNLSINIMTLGGLAIGIGMMVDASVIMSENIFRHIQKSNIPFLKAIQMGAQEVIRPIFFATLIMLAVFAPVFTLHGLEGKMFVPLAVAVSTALLGSLIISMTLTLVLCSYILKPETVKQSTGLIDFFKKLYNPLLNFSLDHRVLMIVIGFILFFFALIAVFFIGTEFMPVIDESSLIMDVFLPPGTSLNESSRIASLVSFEVSKIPEVTRVVRRTGRAEGAEHAEPVNLTECNVVLIPKEDRKRSIHEIEEDIREKVGNIPGVMVSLFSPLQHRINHILTGTKAAIAIKLFGDNLITLQQYAEQIEKIMENIEGAVDIQIEQTTGMQQLQITLDRGKIARYGINIDDVSQIIEVALNGYVPTEIIETHKRYDIFVRFKEEFRSSEDQLKNILVDTPLGVKVPLAELATFKIDQGPAIIRKEGTLRRVIIQCNVEGRDMGSVVSDLRRGIDKIDLPEGYFVSFGGTYESQVRAMKQLTILVILTILIVFILLYTTFNSIRQAFLIIFNIPHAMVGGILMLYFTKMNLSVPSIVGFIALVGICVQDGIVLISYIRHQRESGLPLRDALIKAGNTKLRPVLITTFTTILGLIPIIIRSGTGSEIQRPLGLVLVAGLIFSTGLTLVVLPTVYSLFEEGSEKKIDLDTDH
ncbi:efflux RND transporter permease subunit [candidate division KSB1 bacterium]